MPRDVVVTGIGLLTPLGASADEVLRRIGAGESAAAAPSTFDASAFTCPLCAEVRDFRPEAYVGASKTLRLMNRDAQLAVAAARLAVTDAGLRIGRDYADDEVALFGATGLASMPIDEVARLVRSAAAPDGSLDLRRFGAVALRRVRPVLSFKILSNMPVCFISIFEGIRGDSAVYTPWEGQAAQAIAGGIRAVRRGDAPCAIVGGCDAKAGEFAFLALQQQGCFRSWSNGRGGAVPGEGAAFLVLEDARAARARGASTYARCGPVAMRSACGGRTAPEAVRELLAELLSERPDFVVAADDGDEAVRRAESSALAAGGAPAATLNPKAHLGNLYAAAAAVQVALAAALVGRATDRRRALANCFGHGTEQAAFLLESA